MALSCDVLRMAGESCSQLAGERLPDNFEIAEEYSQTIAIVRQRHTNYETLLDALADCPEDCPIVAQTGEPLGPGCANYDFAHDLLRTSARRLALELYSEWHRGNEVPPDG